MAKRMGNSKGFCSDKIKKRKDPPNSEQKMRAQLGHFYLKQGNLAAAKAIYQELLAFDTSDHVVYGNLGAIYLMESQREEAIKALRQAIEIQPGYPSACNNLGIVLKEQGDLSGAMAFHKQALASHPGNAEAQWNLALLLLLEGDYELGLEKYEWRSKQTFSPKKPHAHPKAKRWTKENLINGEKLLVVSEQGLGDTLQFIRYIPHLKNQGIDVVLAAQEKLHGLIKASGIDDSPLLPQQANAISDGYWTPLLSVPRHLGVSPDNPIATKPYIAATEDLLSKWNSRLENEKRPIIAINWQGNPESEKLGLKGRSLPLELFSKIATSFDLDFLSLQKGFGSEQLETCSFKDRFVSCQDEINQTWDFLETAAIIQSCDLIITSDTATAHLAGGMGKPTWLLLHRVPDWRWGMTHETSFWYPSMRLFRQTKENDWPEVLGKVEDALKIFMSEHLFRKPQKS